MILQLNDNQPMGTTLVTGPARTGPASTRTLSTVVAKAAYDLIDQGGGIRTMTPASDPDLYEIKYADTGHFLFQVGIDIHIIESSTLFDVPKADPDNDDATEKAFILVNDQHFASELDGFVTDYEADIAIEKLRVDIVVEGHVPDPASGGSVTINGTQWANRTITATAIGDSSTNLFGRHAKGDVGRELSFPIPLDEVLPDNYTPLFNNYYRRSTGFTAPVSAATNLPSGGIVRVFQTADQSDTPYAFALPDPFIMTARYRTYCGHGPDKARRWNTGPTISLRADTLIIQPATHQVQILWRGSWAFADEPADTYRKVQIIEGVF